MKLLRFLFILLFISCSGDDDEQPAPVGAPAKAQLEYPFDNYRCLEGASVSEDKTDIVFRWEPGAHSTTFELIVIDLRTQQTRNFFTAESSYTVTLDTGTPYSWQIISYNKDITEGTQSQVRKFFTSGIGITNYAPFPADLILPENKAELSPNTGRVKLEWEGSDVDGEPLTYNLYFGEEEIFSQVHSSGITTSWIELDVENSITYFWKIISVDPAGNTSESDTYRFSTTGTEEDTSGKSSENKINSFSIIKDGVTYVGIIDHLEKKIFLELDNFDYGELSPEINISEAAAVVPASGEAQNFLDALYYTVTAEDGSVAIYDIVLLSGQNEILSFEVHHNGERYIGYVDQENATVTIDLGGTDYSNMQPTIRVSNRATINPSSGVSRNFNRDVLYTITSEKGTTKEYKVIAPLHLKKVSAFFGAGGYLFTPETKNTRFILFAGADLFFQVGNVPTPENLIIELVNETGSYPLEIKNFRYFHQIYMEVANTITGYETLIPYSVPTGTYNYRVRDGLKETIHEHKIEIINDETTIKVDPIDDHDYFFQDTLILTGQNLTKNFTIYSSASHYMFSEYNSETELTDDKTQLSLYLSQNIYSFLSRGDIVKPLVFFKVIDGYDHKVVSNTVYFKIRRW